MAKKEVDGEGLNIPNRIKALPVKRPGPIVAAVIVVLLAAMLIQGMITNPRLDWPTVWKYLFNENVLEGIQYTLTLTVISMVVAIILSVILAIMRKSINPVLRGVSWFFIWFFRGTPVYTQLIFWGLFAVLIPKISLGIPFTSVEFWSIDSNVVVTAFNAAWIGLALNEAAYLSEIVRAGLEAVDPGQTEAAKALGMNRTLIMRRIVLPQAMRIIIPPHRQRDHRHAEDHLAGHRRAVHPRTAVCHQRHRQPYLQADSTADRGLLLVSADYLHPYGVPVPPRSALRQGLRCPTGGHQGQAGAIAG